MLRKISGHELLENECGEFGIRVLVGKHYDVCILGRDRGQSRSNDTWPRRQGLLAPWFRQKPFDTHRACDLHRKIPAGQNLHFGVDLTQHRCPSPV